MEELLKTLIEPLLAEPDKVLIERRNEGSATHFIIHVPKTDIAKVIGKEGRMIKSIKNLLRIRAIKENVYCTLEVVES